jgi:3-hydroxybutyryl-CoA dehydrogenase
VATLANITTFTSLKDASANADLIVEAASENINIKLDIFKQIDEYAPANCILASKHIIHFYNQKLQSVYKAPRASLLVCIFMNPVSQ